MKSSGNLRPGHRHATTPTTAGHEAVVLGARWAALLAGGVVVCAGLRAASAIFAPLTLAVVFGLVFSPAARRIEARRVPPALSALAIVLVTGALMAAFVLAFAWPVSVWIDRLPEIWARVQSEFLSWRPGAPAGLPEALGGGEDAGKPMSLTVDGGGAVESAVLLAPALVSQMIVFLAGVYFFVATRDSLRDGVIGLCSRPSQCRRVDRVVAAVEAEVSRYMLTVAAINAGMGACVGVGLWLAGVPQPWMWGVLAAIMNFVPYVGTAVMIALLTGVGMIHSEGWQVLVPAAVHSAVNLAENQIVTPHVLGRATALNPFAVFFAILFGLWMWGPIGGIVAVPLLLFARVAAESGRPRPAVRASELRARR